MHFPIDLFSKQKVREVSTCVAYELLLAKLSLLILLILISV